MMANDINIAIIGAEGAGKSTLIQSALGLRKPPASVSSSQRLNIDGTTYTISLVELDLEAFDITPDRRILWPKQINGVIVPRFDGALILYDVMNSESISDLPQTLSECYISTFFFFGEKSGVMMSRCHRLKFVRNIVG